MSSNGPLRRAAPHAALALLLLGGCRGAAPRPAATDRPSAEFLVSAGDSTYWIASEPTRVRVRSSSMLLARFDGRLYEVYAADDDRSYYDAIFTTQRIYRRDLVDGDSLPVFDDALVSSLARAYAARHPHERPLDPEEDAAERPRTSATTEVSLVDVHGPFLTYDARDDVDVEGTDGRHLARRMVVDMRTARPATLSALFGAARADSLVAEGRRRLARAIDSVRAVADSGDEAGARALHALPSVRFAADNFGLASSGPRPAVEFVAIGRDVDGHAVTLPLAPIAVDGDAPAWWRADVEPALPNVAPDSSESRWSLNGLEVVARKVRGGGDAAALALRAPPTRGRRGEWPLARVPTPVRQLYALDRTTLDPAARRALARAFNESALYGGDAVAASYRHKQRASRVSRIERVRNRYAIRDTRYATPHR